jgi:pyruvate dehydrogenase E2 component (dihydrolipoamide acetyltransferase)
VALQCHGFDDPLNAMPIELTMPRLSDTMEAGTIIKWNVKEGAKVRSGDVVADIETDKATMEMQAFDDGTIAKLLVPEGQAVPVGTVIAVIAEAGEDAGAIASNSGAAEPAAKGASPAAKKPVEIETGLSVEAASAAKSMTGPPPLVAPGRGNVQRIAQPVSESVGDTDGRFRVSPVARHLADEHGIDVATLRGSGPGGRVIKRDVLQAVEQGAPAAGPARAIARAEPRPSTAAPVLAPQVIPLSNMRQTIAKRLVESKTTIPHYQVTARFNMDPLLDLRSTLNEQLAAQDIKLSVNDFLVRACALAIAQHPAFNSSWAGTALNVHGEINVGIAVSLPEERGGGLVVATIRDADHLGLRQISDASGRLAEKARTKGLTIEEMADSTFTISNLGMFGVDNFTAIINPPNSAILAVGAALEQPVVRNGQIVVGHEMSATLSLDHRVIDGATAARFLQTLKQLIENPATLLV